MDIKIFGYAPGDYLRVCGEPACTSRSPFGRRGVHGTFTGAKGAWRCEPCAEKARAAYVPPAPVPAPLPASALEVLRAADALSATVKTMHGFPAVQDHHVEVDEAEFCVLRIALAALPPEIRAQIEGDRT